LASLLNMPAPGTRPVAARPAAAAGPRPTASQPRPAQSMSPSTRRLADVLAQGGAPRTKITPYVPGSIGGGSKAKAPGLLDQAFQMAAGAPKGLLEFGKELGETATSVPH